MTGGEGGGAVGDEPPPPPQLVTANQARVRRQRRNVMEQQGNIGDVAGSEYICRAVYKDGSELTIYRE